MSTQTLEHSEHTENAQNESQDSAFDANLNKQKDTPTTRFVGIDPYDHEALTLVAEELGLSEGNCLADLISENDFQSSVNITDLSADLPYYTHRMKGRVSVRSNSKQQVQPGEFDFLPGVAQRVLLVTGVVRSKMEKPDPISGCIWGPKQASFICFPETTIENVVKSYRPILRIITQEYTDLKDYQTNTYFSATLTNVDSKISNQLADVVFDAALKVGIPKSEMDIRKASFKEREGREARRELGIQTAKAIANQSSYSLPGLRQSSTADDSKPTVLTLPSD